MLDLNASAEEVYRNAMNSRLYRNEALQPNSLIRSNSEAVKRVAIEIDMGILDRKTFLDESHSREYRAACELNRMFSEWPPRKGFYGVEIPKKALEYAILKTICRHPIRIADVPDELISEKIALRALMEARHAIGLIPKRLITKEFARKVCEESPRAIVCFDPDLLDFDIYHKAIMECPILIRNAPKWVALELPESVIRVIATDSNLADCVPEERMTDGVRSIMEKAKALRDECLKELERQMQDPDYLPF